MFLWPCNLCLGLHFILRNKNDNTAGEYNRESLNGQIGLSSVFFPLSQPNYNITDRGKDAALSDDDDDVVTIDSIRDNHE